MKLKLDDILIKIFLIDSISFFPNEISNKELEILQIHDVNNFIKDCYYSSKNHKTCGNHRKHDWERGWSEDVTLPTSPQHPRGIYIESKRLGEAIVSNLISKNATRVASYRIALATPPRLLNNDHRVLADLITSAKENNKVILNGGQKLLRQYQYGPNAIYKILGSISNGTSNLYNNAGSHILTLGELAKLIGKVFNVDVEIKENIQDSSSPKVVNINSERINFESGYLLDKEEDFFSYLNRIVNA